MLTSRVLDQIARDPSLSVDSVHHDRITGPLTPPDLLGIEERPPMRVFKTSTDFFGQTHAVEVRYEPDPFHPRSVVIHAVTLSRLVCKKGEYWYDGNGNFREGPHREVTDVTAQLDDGQLQAIGAEIIDGRAIFRRRG